MRKDERNEKTRGDKKREQMERRWTKGGNKEVKKTLWKGSMLRRRSRKIKQKRHEKQMKEKLKIRRDRKTQNMKFFRQSLCWKKVKSSKKRRLKRGSTNRHFAIFLEKKKTRREHTKEHFSFLKEQQTRKTFFLRDLANGNNSKNMASCEEGEYVKGENKKEKKNDDQTKQSLQEKEIHKKGSDRGKNKQERELKKKNVQKHMRIKRKKEISKDNKQTCKDK